jgi:two-component system response regulator HydG
MKTDEPISDGASHTRQGGPGALFKVLIVDDDDEASAAIAELVRSLGHEAHRCNQVAAAYDMIRLEGADLVLADYRMPEMTGLDLVAMLRQDGCNVPVIMMTGYAGTLDRLTSERGDRLTVLKKPICLDDLRNAIQEHRPSSPAPASSV